MVADRIRLMRQAHWVTLFAALFAAWLILFAMAIDPDPAMSGLWDAICRVTPGSAGFAGAVAMWALMGGAMMVPTLFPALATYDDLPTTAPGGFWALIGGYVLVWVGFALIAGTAQVLLASLGLLSEGGESLSRGLTFGLLVLAGLYQLTPMKAACLSRCRAPLTFFMAHWAEGPFRNGVRLGAHCLGCCWALMALAFVGGTMNLAFMGLAMVLMTLEKIPAIGEHVTKPLGVGLIALAALSLAV